MSVDENGMVGLMKDRYRDLMKAEKQRDDIKNLYDRYDETDLAVDDFWEVFREELEQILEGESQTPAPSARIDEE